MDEYLTYSWHLGNWWIMILPTFYILLDHQVVARPGMHLNNGFFVEPNNQILSGVSSFFILNSLKSVQIRSFSCPYFSLLGLNTGKSGPEIFVIWSLFTKWYKRKSKTLMFQLEIEFIPHNVIFFSKFMQSNRKVKFILIYNFPFFQLNCLKKMASVNLRSSLRVFLTDVFFSLFLRWSEAAVQGCS